jgi:hypothetical protein
LKPVNRIQQLFNVVAFGERKVWITYM